MDSRSPGPGRLARPTRDANRAVPVGRQSISPSAVRQPPQSPTSSRLPATNVWSNVRSSQSSSPVRVRSRHSWSSVSSSGEEHAKLQREIATRLPLIAGQVASSYSDKQCMDAANTLLGLANTSHSNGVVLTGCIEPLLASNLAVILCSLKTSVSEWIDEELLVSLLHAYVLMCDRNVEAVNRLAKTAKMFSGLKVPALQHCFHLIHSCRSNALPLYIWYYGGHNDIAAYTLTQTNTTPFPV